MDIPPEIAKTSELRNTKAFFRDLKNKETAKQLFEQEYNGSNNCLSSKTIIITIQLSH